MKNLTFILALFSGISSCDPKEVCEQANIPNCQVSAIWKPVCGCDGNSFVNASMAECNSIVDHSPGACAESIKEILGEWEFLGYESDGARAGKPTKVHFFDGMVIEFKDTRIENMFEMSGVAVINRMSATYYTSFSDQLFISLINSTRIAGTTEQLKFEERFIASFADRSFNYIVTKEGYLTIPFNRLSSSLPFDKDRMIFKKK